MYKKCIYTDTEIHTHTQSRDVSTDTGNDDGLSEGNQRVERQVCKGRKEEIDFLMHSHLNCLIFCHLPVVPVQ